ncbi:Biotin synthesis protein bioH [Cronobacter dublinensis 582]|nr:Biotin synthesis protein bioH [Cronobacter dublinensis 582]
MLKSIVLAQQMPGADVLNGGLEILKTADLREALAAWQGPFLRLYGRLDGLVPRKVAALLDARWPASDSRVFDKAAHAPFISHPREFCDALLALKARLANR